MEYDNKNKSDNIIVEEVGKNHFIIKNSNTGKLSDYFTTDEKYLKCIQIKLSSLLFKQLLKFSNPLIGTIYHQVTHIDCKYNDIETFTNLPPQLEIFICSFNKLKRLENLPIKLKYVSASHNNITYVNITSKNTVSIDVSYNNLISYNDLILPDDIKSLNISHNKFKNINLPNKIITRLNADHNIIKKIYELPDKLTSLSVCGNDLKHFILPDKLSNKLKYLNLTGNKLSKLEGNFKNLEQLFISGNKLNEIKANLEIIQELYCSSNNLKYIKLPNTIVTLNCMNTLIDSIKITDKMKMLYLPFDTLKIVTPFKKLIKLYEEQKEYIHCNENDIRNLAAKMIQILWRNFKNNSWRKRKNLNSNDITVII